MRASADGMIDQDDAARLQLAPRARVEALETAEHGRRAARAAAEAEAIARAARDAERSPAPRGDETSVPTSNAVDSTPPDTED